jgi:hypothetical protein
MVTGMTLTPSLSSSAAVADPVLGLTVEGVGVGVFPEFDPGVERYAITTGEDTSGTVTVEVMTSASGAEVSMNGVPDADGTRTLTGLVPGDEIAVFVEDSAGVARYALVYLPPGFPSLERVTSDGLLEDVTPGHVLLTLGMFNGSGAYEVAVDVNGVPAFVRRTSSSVDLQRQPNGNYSVFRPTAADGRTGFDLIELDTGHAVVRTWRTVGLVNTDPHDAILLPDGTAWLMAYEPSSSSPGLVDAIIQHVSADGTVLFEWSSAPFASETTTRPESGFGGDYAHVNSIQVLPDGHLLASFRHLSSIYKIATHAEGEHAAGDVIWKLGGRDSDFAFPEGDVGPCAQHTARMLPNGDVLVFDNGSWAVNSEELCVDPGNPTGTSVARTSTRIVQLQLNEADGTAIPVRSYAPGRFALFAGSSQPLASGATMIGWAAETAALASEINAGGELVWELRDPSSGPRVFSYRAHKALVPDAIAPEVAVVVPSDGASYAEGTQVAAEYECSDRGGSSLYRCAGSVEPGTQLDTSRVGVHTFEVSGTDGAGNVTTETRKYTVLPAARPDAAIRARGARSFQGVGEYGAANTQRTRATIDRPGGRAKVFVRLTNNGALPDRLAFRLKGRTDWFSMGGQCARVRKSPALAPGQSWTCRLVVKRRDVTQPGRKVVVRIPVTSQADPARRDAVSVTVRAR